MSCVNSSRRLLRRSQANHQENTRPHRHHLEYPDRWFLETVLSASSDLGPLPTYHHHARLNQPRDTAKEAEHLTDHNLATRVFHPACVPSEHPSLAHLDHY